MTTKMTENKPYILLAMGTCLAMLGSLALVFLYAPIEASMGVMLDPDGSANGNESNVVYTDIFASNGVVHVIDAVLVPSAN